MCYLIEGGSTSCWVKLNMQAMKKEYQTVRSKRIALGKIDSTGCSLLGFSQSYYIVLSFVAVKLFIVVALLVTLFLKEMRRKASPWQRNLGYPLAMLTLLALTVHTYLLIYSHRLF